MPISKARLKISDYNKNRKMRLKNQERKIRMVSLSLTSMVDMFAILVIFLLTNNNTVTQWIELGHSINLPKAKYSEPSKQAASIQVAKDAVYVDEKKVLTITQAQQSTNALRPILSSRGVKAKSSAYINIVADQKTPFGIIKKVVMTCRESGFENVNLAVEPGGKL